MGLKSNETRHTFSKNKDNTLRSLKLGRKKLLVCLRYLNCDV
jgi:hypothetical protein